MSETLAEAGADLPSRTLSDIATSLPGATAVFRRYKPDFCCGGAATLAEAAATRRIDLRDVAAELAALQPDPQAAVGLLSTPALIDHIEARYHAVHRRELPELVRLARRVEAVHTQNPDVPAGLADLLEIIEDELGTHMQQEEQVLFPLMRQGGHPGIAQPIAVMTADHHGHGAQIRRLEALTGDFETPEGACTTWRALYAGGRKLVDDLLEHIHIENNILFPRFP